MKRIMVTGAGGPAGRNFVRSLRAAPEDFFIAGTDINKYHLQLTPTDKRFLVPHCSAPDYVEILNEIIEAEGIELVHPQPDPEVAVISENRGMLKARTWLPAKGTVRTFQDKLAAARTWEQCGLRRSGTYVVAGPADLERAVDTLGLPLWLRASTGAGRLGATPVSSLAMGIHWLGFWQAQGTDWTFIAQEYLPGRDLSFASIWRDGELVTSLGVERLQYLLPHVLPSRKTGSHSVGISLHDSALNRIATESVQAVDPKASGVFCVDLREDKEGNVVPTEVNCGRFFASCLFYVRAGANLPYYYVKCAFDEPTGPLSRYNAIPAGRYLIRNVDTDSIMVPSEDLLYESRLRGREGTEGGQGDDV